jgi:hypothetical protein
MLVDICSCNLELRYTDERKFKLHDYGRLFEEKDFQVAITKMNWHATAPDQCTGACGAGEGVSIPWAIRSNLTLFPFIRIRERGPHK